MERLPKFAFCAEPYMVALVRYIWGMAMAISYDTFLLGITSSTSETVSRHSNYASFILAPIYFYFSLSGMLEKSVPPVPLSWPLEGKRLKSSSSSGLTSSSGTRVRAP